MRLSLVIDGDARDAAAVVDQVTGKLGQLEARAKSSAAATGSAVTAAGNSAAQAARLTSQQLGQMQFQLQDIAVGLSSGQSPFTVITQQGSQIVQMFQGETGVAGALRSVRAGIIQFILNPLNLAVVGFGLAATAVSAFFGEVFSGTEKTDALLTRHKETVEAIKEAYKGAGAEARSYADSLAPALLVQSQINRANFEEGLTNARTGIASVLANSIQSRTSVGDQLSLDSEGGLAAFRRIVAAIEEAGPGLESGSQSAEALAREINRIAAEAPESALGLRNFAMELTSQLNPLATLERKFRENETSIKILTGTATASEKAAYGLSEAARGATSSIDGLARSLRGVESIGGYGPRSPFAGAPPTFEGKSLLDLIGAAEGTDRGRGYNETLGYGRFTGGPVELITMTLRDVLALQKQMLANPANTFNSSAVGRFQITRETLRDFMPRLGLSEDTIFSPEVQDRIALAIANAAGRNVDRLRGRWEGFNRVSPGTILQAFDGEAQGRSATAQEIEKTKAMLATVKARETEREITELTAEAQRRLNQEMLASKRTAEQMAAESLAFYDQFRDIGDGLVSAIVQARQAGESWTDSFEAGIDMMEQKALSFLDKFIDKALDLALMGKPGTQGGGLLGGLFSGLQGLFGGFLNPMQNALGNAFQGGRVTAFASGGIVSGPALFPLRGGVGLMGEAGPEAIVPLARGPSGHLGIRAQGGGGGATVNIHNYEPVPVKASSRGNGLGGIDFDIVIKRAVREELAAEGTTRNLASRLGITMPSYVGG